MSYNSYLANSYTHFYTPKIIETHYLSNSYNDIQAFYANQMLYGLNPNPIPKNANQYQKYKYGSHNNSYMEAYNNEMINRNNYIAAVKPRREFLVQSNESEIQELNSNNEKSNKKETEPLSKNNSEPEIIKMYNKNQKQVIETPKVPTFPSIDGFFSGVSSIKTVDSNDLKSIPSKKPTAYEEWPKTERTGSFKFKVNLNS